MGACSTTDYGVMAKEGGLSRGASGTMLERREELCGTLFVATADFGLGDLDGHISLSVWVGLCAM